MSRHWVDVILWLSLLVVLVFLVLHWMPQGPFAVNSGSILSGVDSSARARGSSECRTQTAKTSKVIASDNYLEPWIVKGESLSLTSTNCGDIAVGDWVAFQPRGSKQAVLRRVVAVSGQSFRVEPAEDSNQGWRLKVQGEWVRSLDGSEYFFGGSASPPLKLQEDANQGVVPKDALILLSAKGPGFMDSSRVGFYLREDILGSGQKAIESPKQ